MLLASVAPPDDSLSTLDWIVVIAIATAPLWFVYGLALVQRWRDRRRPRTRGEMLDFTRRRR